MEKRAGLNDVLLAFSIISAIVLIGEMASKPKAKSRADENSRRLQNIERKVEALYARIPK